MLQYIPNIVVSVAYYYSSRSQIHVRMYICTILQYPVGFVEHHIKYFGFSVYEFRFIHRILKRAQGGVFNTTLSESI